MSRIQEMRNVMEAVHHAAQSGQQTTILMITEVQGSAYRQPGAKMMMASDGKMLGTLSGGCLESDLLGWSEKALEINMPLLPRYDLSENELWSLGIGCKGSLEILILPVETEEPFWKAVSQYIQKDIPVTMILELPSGVRAVIDDDGREWGDTENLPDDVLHHALSMMYRRTRAETLTAGDRRFVIDTMRPSEKLVIAGAGHDAVPLARLAERVGFAVSVLDPRSQYNNAERFPGAQHLVMEPDHAFPDSLIDSWWVIMNHQQDRDEKSLDLALKSAPKFVGVLGPLSRTEKMLEHIGQSMSGGPIFAPVGLDLAAETIDEVAVSIVSQLMALRNGRDASPLHGRGKIHV